MPHQTSLRALYQRVLRFVFRTTIAGLVFVALLYCSLRVYSAYLTDRALSLLNEATSIKIGATEESILPLVARYGGSKFAAQQPVPIDDCPSKPECKRWNAHLPDYSYGIGISPFKVFYSPERATGWIHRAMTALMIRTPSSWRDPFALRDWEAYADINIRAGRVEAVDSGVYLEGRGRWLANTWRLSADMPQLDMKQKTYVNEGTFLTFPGDGGAGTVHYLTPAATPEQFQAAQSFNTSCLTGLSPCRCLSELSPRAFQYLEQHPDAGGTIMTDDCPNPRRP